MNERSIVCIVILFLENTMRYQPMRDIDDRTNSSLTESRHVSMQANVPTNGSMRVLPVLEDEASFEQTNTTAISRAESEQKKI